jgi:tRNA-2-methylthio-N6-dimethylallyladenosine synthase
MSKTYHIITFGCQMNKSDSERLAAVVEAAGFLPTEKLKNADLVMINACSVRQTGIDRIYGMVRNYERMKKKRPLITILTGCLLPVDQEKLVNRFDLVFGIKNIGELKSFLHSHQLTSLRQRRIGLWPKPVNQSTANYLDIKPVHQSKFSAYVPIMTGCNNFCSYCAVPYARGRETSRDVKSILKEIKKLAKKGYLQITLLGQNVNSYQPADVNNFSPANPFTHNFARLLWEVNQIDGIKRINFTSAHPKDMDDQVIQALALPKMVNYLHLALQSGADEILQKMNRQYTVKDYDEIIKKIRQVKPKIALGTDIIVGFPGETKEQFANTLKFYKKAGFDICFLAKYSPRSGTAAAKLVDDVPAIEKKNRWRKLQNLMEEITLKKNQQYLNKKVAVLIDTCKNGYSEGDSLEMKRVRIQTEENLVGKIIEVKIKKAMTWMLEGEIC